MDTNAYLERIGYRGPLAPTAETLRRLHLAHLLSVPFENLSIHAGEPIVLDDEALFDKIVVRGRGGFCYELNGLFAALLRSLGFKVEMLSAAVMGRAGEFGPEFDHMALLVTLAERWRSMSASGIRSSSLCCWTSARSRCRAGALTASTRTATA
jgi:N-hydroxyarylamine O-acetyltransferase